MKLDRKGIKKEKKRLKFIREARSRRNESKRKYEIASDGVRKFKNQKSKK